MFPLLITLFLLLSGTDVDDWQWRPGVGFVNTETMERKSPEEFHAYGARLSTERRTDDALEVMSLLLRNVRDRKVQEEARYLRGKILWSGGRFHDACLALDDFLRRHPGSAMAEEAKRLEMDSALSLAKKGYAGNFWGSVPLLKWIATSSKMGLDLLRTTLQRYPREPFSSLYYFKLAEFLFDEKELDAAEQELKFLLSEYPATADAPRAILLLGRIGMKKYDSVEYDIHGLKEARRHFARFVEEAPLLSKISPEAADFIAGSLPYAKGKIAFIDDKEAEKEFRVGEYYRRKGHLRAARIYYEWVRKEYAGTTWAAEAGQKLKELFP